MTQEGYSLIDSGDGEKLERFGEILLRRPSSLALWQKKKPERWSRANASYIPERGWTFLGKAFDSWECNLLGTLLRLHLQNNGQVGVFPDHLSYLAELIHSVEGNSRKNLRALNLFAYTGLATSILARMNVQVTHIDLSKQALSWARENLTLNRVSESLVRLIPEDAIKFALKDAGKNSQYDLIILDPPSFGRISKTKSWKLEEVLGDLLSACFKLLVRDGTLYFTCHHSAFGPEVLFNILSDYAGDNFKIKTRSLAIPENGSERKLPAGFLGVAFSG